MPEKKKVQALVPADVWDAIERIPLDRWQARSDNQRAVAILTDYLHLRAELDDLRRTNRELELENATLKGRVGGLERGIRAVEKVADTVPTGKVR